MLSKYGYYNQRARDKNLPKAKRDYAESFCLGANNSDCAHSSKRKSVYHGLPKNHPDYEKSIAKPKPAKNELAFRAGQKWQREQPKMDDDWGR